MVVTNYSKKVIENFMNPKNMGSMENPDAVGKAGNPVCLLPHQRIDCNPKYEEIENLGEGNLVLSHMGAYAKIIGISSRKYSGNVIVLRTRLGHIALTPEHLVFAIKVPPRAKYLITKNKKELMPAWYHCSDLRKQDMVLYPILKDTKHITEMELDIPKSKFDFKSKPLPKSLPINAGMLRLFGYYLSEGSISLKPSKLYINFTLNINEKDICQDIKEISKKLFGIDVKIKEIPKRKTIQVYLNSAILARFFNKLFSKGAANKKIPSFMLSLPPLQQRELLIGLWKGDGYINIDRAGPRAGYSTISYQLCQQIKMLLLRQGIIPSIYIDKERIKDGVNHKLSYRIHIGERDSLIRLAKLLGYSYEPKVRGKILTWLDDNYLYVPITSVKSQQYDGTVFNLEVETDHSFTSEAFCLHNCGDMLELHLRIGKNKEGKEIIEDIKFKTLGCAAAISTSSMITEIAKGKTIEEAMKITKGEVAESLDGLPPIKMHCSNLAADALHDALKNYLAKKQQ